MQRKTPDRVDIKMIPVAPVTKDSFVYYPIKDNRIKVDLNNPQKASLFDYFSHIELIPLETSDKVLIGRLGKIICHQNRYYTLDILQAAVQVFDENGKFIQKIGKSGQGPEEYLPLLYDIIINPFTGNIDLLCPYGWVYSYDLSGKYMKTSDKITNEDLLNINQLTAINEKIYVFISFAHPFYIAYYDIEEKKILSQEYENYSRNSLPGFYFYNNRWYFKPVYDNMIYEVAPNSLIESYSLDFGKFNYKIKEEIFPRTLTQGLTTSSQIDAKLTEAQNKYPYRIRYQGQNYKYVIAQIMLKNEENSVLIYDKSINESKFIKIFADLVDFFPYIVTNEYVLSWCQHGALEKHISEEMLDETNRQKFKKLINTVGELNPVIIKYYFK